MKKTFPFVEVHESLHDVVGIPKEGTRTYNAYGYEEDYPNWFNVIDAISQMRGVFTPVAAADYVQVSRVSVHQKLKEGKLTAFYFHKIKSTTIQEDKNIYETDGLPTCFIPVFECLAWGDIRRGLGDIYFDEYSIQHVVTKEDLVVILQQPVDRVGELIKKLKGEQND